MNYFITMNKCVTGFRVDNQFIDCISNDSVFKIDKQTKEIVYSTKLFKKEGFSRNLISNHELLIIRDFYTLYILDKNNYSCVSTFQLGTDLRTDICGMTMDETNIYACIRNGSIIVIELSNLTIKGVYHVSSSSIWDIKVYSNVLIGGNVEGNLLLIDKIKMEPMTSMILGKQNIGSISLQKNKVYAAGQDKTLYFVDLEHRTCITNKRNVHKRMFDCVGIYNNFFITISYPCSEISFWNKETLEFVGSINIPLSLSGRTFIEDNILFVASRNINGIISLDLRSNIIK
ncbi:hypothetical protein [Anaerocolumna sp. MB42-C2]|uniref:hypothetical protein n=1 Tax=Anaerocolumna sp. MB42-C2 TaxID=3070997 RepID=UPI0027DFAD54|nr:hypothetical protein [Anaerocolumna sp. MB42-C2]WMJ88947.1 hypothetical protein RBU59_05350 [Anaerocolumna sp. MB42-C2]